MIDVRTAGQLGYCSGVFQAIEKAIKYGDRNGKVYSLGNVAHNEEVVALLKKHGVEPIGLGDIAAIQEMGKHEMHVVITAHGAPPDTYVQIAKYGCAQLDCTCPIVRNVQDVVAGLHQDGFDIVIFGDPEHQEVKGLLGWAHDSTRFVGNFPDLFTPGQDIKPLGLGKRVGVVSQTTKVSAMYGDFIGTLVYHHVGAMGELRVFNTICPIVSARVEQTRHLAAEVDILFVVGSEQSANTRNLALVGMQEMGKRLPEHGAQDVHMVQDEQRVAEVLGLWFAEYDAAYRLRSPGYPIVGVTAGTSTPIEVVERVVNKLREVTREG